LEKKLKINIAARLSRNPFFVGKSSENRPRFSCTLFSIELKVFPRILDSVWGRYFFSFEKYCPGDFDRFYKICPSEKKQAFLGVLPVF
jgi:hypothetical protein